MNEDTLKDMPEYLKTLPKSIQDVVFDGVWEERTEEIAKKYSLNELQTDSLTNNVLYILIGLENPDNFLDTIVAELGISRLLAEQITEDLEVRVFEYTVKSIEKRGETMSKSKPQISNEVQNPTAESIPRQSASSQRESATSEEVEIRPEITPMVEPEEKVHVLEPTVNTNRVWPRRINLIEPEQKPFLSPVSSSALVSVSVPRYTGEVTENKTEIKPTESQKPREPVPPIVKNYVVDPYREPIE